MPRRPTIQGFANAHPWLSFVVALRRQFQNPEPAIWSPWRRLCFVAALRRPFQTEECETNCPFATSTEYAPWFVIPADHKWYTRLCVSQIIVAAPKSLDLKYPKVTDAALAALEEAKKELLESEE